MRKFFCLETLFIILIFLLVYTHLMQFMDTDLGWHLRFGRDVLVGNFPFTDTYRHHTPKSD
ncbi:MAG: hypothetical protein HY984_01920 [Candidatus Magasanikbacteria bacterium]|nr:hypothetical protein [Candidatus Magasanikbacteria bacterium]